MSAFTTHLLNLLTFETWRVVLQSVCQGCYGSCGLDQARYSQGREGTRPRFQNRRSPRPSSPSCGCNSRQWANTRVADTTSCWCIPWKVAASIPHDMSRNLLASLGLPSAGCSLCDFNIFRRLVIKYTQQSSLWASALTVLYLCGKFHSCACDQSLWAPGTYSTWRVARASNVFYPWLLRTYSYPWVQILGPVCPSARHYCITSSLTELTFSNWLERSMTIWA